MSRLRPLTLTVLLLISLVLPSAPAAAQTLPSAVAERVFGQPDLDSSGTGWLSFPYDVQVHAASDTLFVLDYDGRTVYRWNNASTLDDGAAEDAQFAGSRCNDAPPYTAGCLLYPYQLAVDADGGVWVADSGTRRLLYFADAVSAASGQPASRVLGAANFTDPGDDAFIGVFLAGGRLYGLTETTLYSWPYETLPESGAAPDRAQSWPGPWLATAAADAQDGGIWLALWDPEFVGANPFMPQTRTVVHYYADPSDLSVATGVLGWRSGDSDAAPSASQVGRSRLAVAADGTLFVSDQNHHRVLGFRDAVNKAQAHLAAGGGSTAQTADLLYGQTGWTSRTSGGGASGLATPLGLTVDSSRDALYVVDANNRRVLQYRYEVRQALPDEEIMPTTLLQPVLRDCRVLPDLAVSPANVSFSSGLTATLEVALRNVGTTPHGYSDLVISLSDGLHVLDAGPLLNLGQRAALQIDQLAANETVSYRVTVAAAEALPTPPVFVVEQYCGGRVLQRIDGSFAAPPAPSLPPTAVESTAAAPEDVALPTELPNTAVGRAAGALPLLVTALAALLLGWLSMGRRERC